MHEGLSEALSQITESAPAIPQAVTAVSHDGPVIVHDDSADECPSNVPFLANGNVDWATIEEEMPYSVEVLNFECEVAKIDFEVNKIEV